jgi:hypothetical protein
VSGLVVGSLKLLKQVGESASVQRCSKGKGMARGANEEIGTDGHIRVLKLLVRSPPPTRQYLLPCIIQIRCTGSDASQTAREGNVTLTLVGDDAHEPQL